MINLKITKHYPPPTSRLVFRSFNLYKQLQEAFYRAEINTRPKDSNWSSEFNNSFTDYHYHLQSNQAKSDHVESQLNEAFEQASIRHTQPRSGISTWAEDYVNKDEEMPDSFQRSQVYAESTDLKTAAKDFMLCMSNSRKFKANEKLKSSGFMNFVGQLSEGKLRLENGRLVESLKIETNEHESHSDR
jgi:hypothetical protein